MKNLKKVCLWLVALVLSVFALASCTPSTPAKGGAEAAAKKVVVQQDKQEVSTDFLVAAVVKGDDGITYTVTWVSDNEVAKVSESRVDSNKNPNENGNFWLITVDYSNNTEAVQTVNLTATIANGDDTATKAFTFKVPQATGATHTIAEALVAQPSEEVTVKGTIIATNARGFIIEDETGKINAYLGSSYAKDLKIGDVAVVSGKVGSYSGAPQFTEGTAYYVTSTVEYTQPTPTELTTAQLVELAKNSTTNPVMQYVKFNGKLSISGSYVNIYLEGTEEVVGSLAYPHQDFSELDNQKVIVEGWFVYVTGSGKYVNVIATNVKMDGAYVEPTYTNMKLAEATAAADGTGVIVAGRVKSIDTPWDEGHGNITVTITDGVTDLYIYRLETNVNENDYIEITGKVGSYNGAKQIVNGTAEVKGHYQKMTIADALAAADDSYVIVNGTVKEINTPWSDQYGNVTITITDGTNDLYVFRTVTNVAVGDEVTLYGVMDTYNDARQIAQGSYCYIAGQEAPEPVENAWTRYMAAQKDAELTEELVGVVFALGFKENAEDATRNTAYAMVVTADGPVYVFGRGFTQADWNAKFVINNNVKLVSGKKDLYNGLNEYVVTDLANVEKLEAATAPTAVDVTNIVADNGLTSAEIIALQGGLVTITGKVVLDGGKYYIQSGENQIQIYADNKFYAVTLADVLVADSTVKVTAFLGYYNKAQLTPYADGWCELVSGPEVNPDPEPTPDPEPSTEPAAVETTVAALVATKPTENMAVKYVVTATWELKAGGATYGNGWLKDENGNQIVIYGLCATSSVLTWDAANNAYTYKNDKSYESLNLLPGAILKVEMVYTVQYDNYSAYVVEVVFAGEEVQPDPEPTPTPGDTSVIEITSTALGLGNYAAGTATVGGVAFEFVELGDYGNGIQWRNKGTASSLWNTAAFSKKIAKIELVYNAAKATYSNADALKIEFGTDNTVAGETLYLSTVKGQTTAYTITPTGTDYTFVKFTINITYSIYFDSITIYFAEEESTEPTPEPEVPTVEAQKPDFETFNNGTHSSTYKEYTSTSGWVATNCAINSGNTAGNNSNPSFACIGTDADRAVTLNGKTTAIGKLTSCTLSNGIKKLSFNYTHLFSDTKFSLTINIKDAEGNVVATKNLDWTAAGADDKYTVDEFVWELETPVQGDFVIEIVNNCPSNSTSNKDRATIWNLTWLNA